MRRHWLRESAMKKFIANLKAKVKAWRSTDFHGKFLCQTPLFHLGLWFEKEGANGVGVAVRTVMRTLMLYETGYTLAIGHPMLAYHSWGQDLHLTIEEIASVFMTSLFFSQACCLIYKKEHFERLFRAIAEMQRCADLLPLQPRSILDRTRRWAKLTLLYAYASVAGLLISYTSVPHLIATRSFMYRTWFPINEQISPNYEILFLLVFINHAQAILVMVFVNTLFMGLLVQAIGHFRLLRCNLRDVLKTLPSPQNPADRNMPYECVIGWRQSAFRTTQHGDSCSRAHAQIVDYWRRALSEETLLLRREKEESGALSICVRHHNAILDFIKAVKSTFNEVLFMQLVCSLVPPALGIILVIYADNVKTRTMTYLILVVAGYAGTGLICWLADKVTEESELVRDAVFGCAWLSASAGFKRSMRIIMSRANQPVVIRVAGFIALSVETFYSVMKLTYSYFMASWTYFNKSVQR